MMGSMAWAASRQLLGSASSSLCHCVSNPEALPQEHGLSGRLSWVGFLAFFASMVGFGRYSVSKEGTVRLAFV